MENYYPVFTVLTFIGFKERQRVNKQMGRCLSFVLTNTEYSTYEHPPRTAELVGLTVHHTLSAGCGPEALRPGVWVPQARRELWVPLGILGGGRGESLQHLRPLLQRVRPLVKDMLRRLEIAFAPFAPMISLKNNLN